MSTAGEAIRSIFGSRDSINTDPSSGWQIGKESGAMGASAGPAAFANTVIEKYHSEQARKVAMEQEAQKARQAGLQRILTEGAMAPEGSQARTAAMTLSEQLTKNPLLAQAAGLPPKDLTSGASFLNLGGTTNVGTDPLAGLQGLAQQYPGMAVNAKLGGGLTANIPLNAKPTEQESNAITGSIDVNTSVDKALELIGQGTLKNKKGKSSIFKQMGTDFGNQLLIPDNSTLESLVSEINNLKSRIPFAKGGKQLTPFESKLLFRLLDTTGKSDETIVKDLSRFKTEFNNMSKLAQGGKMSAPEMLKGSNAVTTAQKTGGQVMVDSSGNRAIVYPDGTVEEI